VDGRLVGDRLGSERDDLLKAVDRAHPRLATAADLEQSTQVAGGVEQSARLSEIARLDAARAATDRQLSVLESLISNLARVDGPKAILLMSEGFGGDGGSARVRAIAASAARAGVRFHVLDESGSDRDAAGGLARATGGSVTRRANAFAAAIPSIATATTVMALAAPAARPADGVPPSAGSPAGVPTPSTAASMPAASGVTAAVTPAAATGMTTGVVVATPTVEPNVLRVRPLAESDVINLAGGDWSDAAARKGWEAYQRGDLEGVRAALAPIAARPAAPSWVEYVLGQADYGLGEFRGAAAAWERVRARQPQYHPVYLDLADDYVKLDERKKAIEVLREGRKRWPKDGDILNALGVIIAGGGDVDQAIEVLNEAIALAPRETISYLNLAKALEMRYFKKLQNLKMLHWRTDSSTETERKNAIKAYQRYLATGGEYGSLARDGIKRLEDAAIQRRR